MNVIMGPIAWSIMLLLAGVIIGLAEIFVPSGGVLMIMSIVAFVSGLYFAFQANAIWGLTMLVATPVVMIVAVGRAFAILPKTRIGKRLILQPSKSNPDGASVADSGRPVNASGNDPSPHPQDPPEISGLMIDARGVTRSELRPAGVADIGGRRVQVVSSGAYIAEGAAVRVCEFQGNRVVVEQVLEQAQDKT